MSLLKNNFNLRPTRMHRSVKGANSETFSQLLLLQLLHHHTSNTIYIHHNDNIEEKYGLITRAYDYPIFLDAC